MKSNGKKTHPVSLQLPQSIHSIPVTRNYKENYIITVFMKGGNTL